MPKLPTTTGKAAKLPLKRRVAPAKAAPVAVKTAVTPATTKTATNALPPFAVQKPIQVRQPDGSVLVKPGPVQLLNGEEEVTAAEFKRLTGLSLSRIEALCNEGLIRFRRKTPKKKSHFLIPKSEVERYRNITE
jgi:hypothetical protein